MTRVKICGLRDNAMYDVAREAGADYVGFVFFPPSPRFLLPEAAGAIGAPGGPLRVGLFVDADDVAIAHAIEAARLDLLQLQGHETPERTHAVRQKFGLKVITALPVAVPADLNAADVHDAADYLMFDAKPPPGAVLPGGNARSFDWTMLAGRAFAKPWFLAGGLTPQNVAEAIAVAAPFAVDVSSGVEAARGVKDATKIRAFIAAVRQSSGPRIACSGA